MRLLTTNERVKVFSSTSDISDCFLLTSEKKKLELPNKHFTFLLNKRFNVVEIHGLVVNDGGG